jgi:1,2-diacylglycerol 3-beta-galactosyltransferase
MRIHFFYSNSGGGHFSAARALSESIERLYPGKFQIALFDVISYAPEPFNHILDVYPMIRSMQEKGSSLGYRVYESGYYLVDNKIATTVLGQIAMPIVKNTLANFLAQNPCDLIVSTYTTVNGALARLLRGSVPYAIVDTDFGAGHAFWFERDAAATFVSNQAAYDRALKLGLSPSRVQTHGLPIARAFTLPKQSKLAAQEKLGWNIQLPMLLLTGGGDGMGKVYETARAVNECRLNVGLAIVCGRNEQLLRNLKKCEWNIPIFLYGFLDDMATMMDGADILLTKAGNITLAEAFARGLPIIIYDRIRFQEDGGVNYVTENGAGVFTPNLRDLLATLRVWVEDAQQREGYARASARLANPQAADNIAKEIVKLIQ